MAELQARTISDRTMTGITKVVKLLPSTTVFAFQTLNPSFSNRGECLTSNRYLTASLIILCSVACAFFSITDSVVHNGKLYFGIATFRGFYFFNFDESDSEDDRKWLAEWTRRRCRLKVSDGVHVVLTVVVFLAVAFREGDVQDCFFPAANDNQKQLLKNLPLGFEVIASIVFMLILHTRKGIGYTDDSREVDSGSSTEMERLRRRSVLRH